MKHVLVLGAGKIGSLIATLLSQHGDYQVYLGDVAIEAAERLVQSLELERVTPCCLDV
ncbi:MAG: saccharopine dehydrogenase NADP-binding domain-containing protein, partial [Nitrospira sp.]